MPDIFMCALKMLIGEKFNAWHAFIEKRLFVNTKIFKKPDRKGCTLK